MACEELSLGQLVFSKAGRDAGRPMIVVGFWGDRYVLVADGELRRVDRPKRKNVRHLQPTRRVHAELAAKLKAGEPVTDQELREAVAQLAAGWEGNEDGHGQEGHD